MPKNKQNMNRAGNMDIDAWRNKQIAMRLKARLEESERRFALEHAGDTDEALRGYVRHRAAVLGRMPHPLELEGGAYLHERLGDWAKLSRQLGYRPPGPQQEKQIRQRLRKREEELFAEERLAIKKRKKQIKRLREQKAEAARRYAAGTGHR